MEQYCSNGTVQDHNCRLNNSLRMGSGYLMDTHNMTLFSKTKTKKPQNLKEADGTNLDIMKCQLFHIHHFFSLDWTKHAFFNQII